MMIDHLIMGRREEKGNRVVAKVIVAISCVLLVWGCSARPLPKSEALPSPDFKTTARLRGVYDRGFGSDQYKLSLFSDGREREVSAFRVGSTSERVDDVTLIWASNDLLLVYIYDGHRKGEALVDEMHSESIVVRIIQADAESVWKAIYRAPKSRDKN